MGILYFLLAHFLVWLKTRGSVLFLGITVIILYSMALTEELSSRLMFPSLHSHRHALFSALKQNKKQTFADFVFQIPAVPTQTLPTASYSPLKTKMDWNRSSFTSKKPKMPYMETTVLDPHSAMAMTLMSPTRRIPTLTLTIIWVMGTCSQLGTNLTLAIRETYLPERTSFDPMKWKYFTRRTKTDNI